MKVLVARKEYVYYYLEYMYSNVQYIETGDRTDEFKQIAHALDLDILAVGNFEPASLSTKVFTIDEFAALYFELRDRKQVLDDEQEHLEEYCNILEEFLAKK